MTLTSNSDVASFTIRLNELKSEFDKCMREGDTFEHVKELYYQIKESESSLNVLDWNTDIHANTSRPPASFTETQSDHPEDNDKYRHILEPHPLL